MYSPEEPRDMDMSFDDDNDDYEPIIDMYLQNI